MPHLETHSVRRIGWLRAAVLGANDGIVSTASLVLGVAAAGASSTSIMTAGVAGLVAGSMAMAAGEYVSVSSQADTQRADLDRERKELSADPEQEHREMTAIYVARGLDVELAAKVATQLMAHDALGAHSRDELGISDTMTARPVQAALASAVTFSVGAALCAYVGCFWKFTSLSRSFRLPGCAGRRRFRADCCHAGYRLGRLGDGRNRWGRSVVWGSRLIPAIPDRSNIQQSQCQQVTAEATQTLNSH